MNMTSETDSSADAVQREPITLDDIRAIHDQTTWDAVKATKAKRDDMIRKVLDSGRFTARQVADALGMTEQHVGRIRSGETSGAARYRNAEH